MNLFRHGPFRLSSGQETSWKIDCDLLTREDWITLAHVGAQMVPPFCEVEPVPGHNTEVFAQFLLEHAVPASEAVRGAGILIVDDVLTTGRTMERARAGRRTCWGLVVFSRAVPPPWITAIFRCNDPTLK